VRSARPTARNAARDLAQIAVFAGLIAALGVPGGLQFPWMPAPITFQTLGVMLAGAILGFRKGTLAVLLFLVLVAAGLPLLAGGRGGIAYLTTAPSAGYAWGFLVGAAFIGYFTERMLPNYVFWKGLVITAIGGIVLVYAVGIPVTALNTDLTLWAAATRAVVYLPGDLIKVLVTVVVAQQVHRAYPGLIGGPRRTRGDADPGPTTDSSSDRDTVTRDA